MGGFHIGFGGSNAAAADALGTMLRNTQALRQAAQQQQQYQDQMQQRAFENQMQLMQQGGTPFEPYAAAPGTGPSTSSVPGKSLKPRNQAVEPPGKGQVVQEPISGKHFYLPTPQEKAEQKKTPEESYVTGGDLGEALERYAGIAQGSKIPMSHMAPFISGINAQGKPEKYTYNWKTDNDGNVNVTRIKSEDGTPESWNGKAWVPLDTSNGMAGAKREPADTVSVLPGYAGPHGEPVMFNKSTQSTSTLPLPAGAKPALTENQQRIKAEQEQREADRNQAHKDNLEARKQRSVEIDSEKHDKLQKDEQEKWALRSRYAELADSKDESVIDPRTGNEVPLTDARKKAYRALSIQSRKEAEALAEQQKAIRRRQGWGEFEQQTGGNPYRTQQAGGGR